MSLDPFSLNLVEAQGILSSLTLGWPLLKGGPVHIENPSGSRAKISKGGEEFMDAVVGERFSKLS